jgi:hypothetical protein
LLWFGGWAVQKIFVIFVPWPMFSAGPGSLKTPPRQRDA